MADSVEAVKTAVSSTDVELENTNLSLPNEAPGKRVTTYQLHDPNVSESLLLGLTLSPCQLNTEVSDVVETQDARPINRPETEVYTISTKMTCILCQCNFTSRQQQRDHYKQDWHRFNLKQRIMGASVVTEELFENISGDVSSISGSDSSTDGDSDNDSDRSPYSNSGSLTPDASNQSDKREMPGCPVIGRNHPKVFFRNGDGQLLSVQRCILHGKKNAPSTQQELVALATQLRSRLKWIVLMVSGGHFAGAVFDGKDIVAHKTFHRYTVRAKRGTAQGMRDSQQGGNQPKSAGASLRRYNEAALVEDIQALLAGWEDQIAACHRIFLRAPSYNKGAFFGGRRPPLDRRDARIITIPFATRRPTYKEIVRVHRSLSNVECYGDANEAERRIVEAHLPKSRKEKTDEIKSKDDKMGIEDQIRQKLSEQNGRENSSDDTGNCEDEDIQLVLVEEEISTLGLQEFETDVKKPKRPKRKRKPKNKPENDGQGKADSVEEALVNACREGDWDRLKQLALCSGDGVTFDTDVPDLATSVNRPIDGRGNTLLHVAVGAEKTAIVWNLMDTGADPAVKNQKGQLPYVLCKNKELRNVFRRFMAAYPDKFDYEKAQIPSPLSSDKEEMRAAKAAEKRRNQKKNKRVREKEQKEEQKLKDEERREREAEEDEKRRFALLSDREKRALAAERRFQAQVAEDGSATDAAKLSNSRRCWLCGTSLVAKVPFEYLDYKFCTIQCVKQHKQQQKTST